MSESTLVLIKPDGVSRRLIGEVIARFERKGLQITAMKMLRLSDEFLAAHYAHLVDKPFYGDVVAFMKMTPVVALRVTGKDAVGIVRSLCGVTDASLAAPGTIRGDLGTDIQANIVHASDSLETANDEIVRFFSDGELFDRVD